LQKVVSAGSVRFTARGILGHIMLEMVNHYLHFAFSHKVIFHELAIITVVPEEGFERAKI